MIPKKQLWERLKAYQFEDLVPSNMWDRLRAHFGDTNASTKAFAAKLASKNGWSLEFALRALEEYKKYVFLGVTAKSAVTPSKVIDAVWHEHGLFMDGYRHFRQEVIEHDFLHYPELMPAEDCNDMYRDQYLKTVALYLREFGHVPPADIWARPKYPPRPGGIRDSQKRSGTHRAENEYYFEELVDTLMEILRNLDLDSQSLMEMFQQESVEHTDAYPEFAEPSHEGQADSSSHEGTSTTESGDTGGGTEGGAGEGGSGGGEGGGSGDGGGAASCSSGSCSSSCGGGCGGD